ncbi:3,4-dihydroxy-2-butanone-4-phosphate synthase [Sphingobium aromaticiconvertens]|uniref:3,4-dihydroxy-2-butanone-4-phosphate synthase n=1 Tax=Sphingobium aromaticiconvertens TaxID=365341 RepID=UPI0030176B1D
MDGHTYISPVNEIIDEARNGRMFILVDDEDRENEGDLVIPAQMATPDAINFMATHGRGLICLALTRERVDALQLSPMSRSNSTPYETAFTISIEAKSGVTTGISAADRARTISTAIDAANGPGELVSPGHVFPLTARDGGVLIRAGHTEAAVDVAKLAGLNPSGVICEIMNDNGSMARMPDLVEFARRHKLKIGTIRDLIAYRLRHDHLVRKVAEVRFDSPHGRDWKAITYRNQATGLDTLTLLKGAVDASTPTLVRMHTLNIFSDVLGVGDRRTDQLKAIMRAMDSAGSGIVVVFNSPAASIISSLAQAHIEFPIDDSSEPEILRDYGTGAQILAELAVGEMILFSNTPHALAALSGYGLTVVEERRICDEVLTEGRVPRGSLIATVNS